MSTVRLIATAILNRSRRTRRRGRASSTIARLIRRRARRRLAAATNLVTGFDMMARMAWRMLRRVRRMRRRRRIGMLQIDEILSYMAARMSPFNFQFKGFIASA